MSPHSRKVKKIFKKIKTKQRRAEGKNLLRKINNHDKHKEYIELYWNNPVYG